MLSWPVALPDFLLSASRRLGLLILCLQELEMGIRGQEKYTKFLLVPHFQLPLLPLTNSGDVYI